MQYRDELIDSLQRQFEEGKHEIITLCDQAIAKQGRDSTSSQRNSIPNTALQSIDTNSQRKSKSHEVVEKSTTSTMTKNSHRSNDDDSNEKKKTSKTIKFVKVIVSSGPYAGNTHVLKPRPRHPCFVGRSAGKKFREKGISLADDPEISTTHGKFEMKNRKIFFIDMGSTNGTLKDGVELEDNTPYEVVDGMELLLGGQTRFKLSLGYN